jgi:hypothetical protein
MAEASPTRVPRASADARKLRSENYGVTVRTAENGRVEMAADVEYDPPRR